MIYMYMYLYVCTKGCMYLNVCLIMYIVHVYVLDYWSCVHVNALICMPRYLQQRCQCWNRKNFEKHSQSSKSYPLED